MKQTSRRRFPCRKGIGNMSFWSSLPKDARHIHGVGFEVKTALLQNIQESPIAIDERLSTLRLPLDRNRFATFMSVVVVEVHRERWRRQWILRCERSPKLDAQMRPHWGHATATVGSSFLSLRAWRLRSRSCKRFFSNARTPLWTPSRHAQRSTAIPLDRNRFATFMSVNAPTIDTSDDVKDRFYDTLYSTLRMISPSDKIILLGKFYARDGRNHDI